MCIETCGLFNVINSMPEKKPFCMNKVHSIVWFLVF